VWKLAAAKLLLLTTLLLQVFTQRNFDSRLLSTEVEFYWHKQRYRVFVPPFGGLGVNVHGSTMAHWKARGRLPISATWTFFASCHDWGAMTGYWSQFSCLKGGGSLSGGNRLFQDYWRLKTRVPGLSRGVVCVISRFRTIPAWKRYAQTDTQRRLILAHS